MTLQRIVAHIHYVKNANRRATRVGLFKAAELLKELSQELVPVDTGRLKASVRIEDQTVDPNHPRVVVIYDTPYAIPVHERLDVFHPNGQAKYLEEPARTHRKALISIINETIRTYK